MKPFETVTVVCDQGGGMQRLAQSIRAFLEGQGLHVHFYNLVQKRDVLKLLAGQFPPTRYTVICCHGGESPETGKQFSFEVVHQKDDDYENPNGWERITFALTPANIAQYVGGEGRTFLSIACGSGHEDFARAFLEAGCDAFIAPRAGYVDSAASVLFVAGFFYFLLAESRDEERVIYSEEEAVQRASGMDADYTYGTRSFFCYTKHRDAGAVPSLDQPVGI